MPEKNHWQHAISRRRSLALFGAAGTSALAGCLGGDDDGNGDDNGNGNNSDNGNGDPTDALGPEPEDVEHDYNENYEDWDEAVPSGAANPFDKDIIFNPHHSGWNSGDVQEMGFEYLSVYHTGEGEYINRVADGWDIGDNLETEITLKEDYGFSNGDDVTAADFETTIRLQGYQGMGIDTYVDPDEGVTTDGDYTLVLQPREEFQDLEESFWESQFAEVLLHVSDAHYRQFVEEFEDASDDDAVTEAQRILSEFDPGWDQTMFPGPFVFVEANEEYADQAPNPNHPATDGWEFYFRHGQAEDEEGLQAGDVTFHHQGATFEGLPDKYDEPPVSYSGQSFALLFGPQDQYIHENPDVRKALAYAIDHQNIVDATSPATPVDTYSAGIDIGYIEHFVEESALEAMTDYSVHDTDRATELLEGTGFSLDDGTWYTPDDEQWTLDFPQGDWFNTAGGMISDSLTEFGIDPNHTQMEMDAWTGDHGETLDYDISVHLNYGMARQYHAVPDFEEEFFDATRAIVSGSEMLGEEVEVPEVGNPEGDTFTLNFRDALDNLATADSDEERIEISTQLAWAHNQLLPNAMIHPWSEQYWVDTEGWNFDVESDDWLTSNRITHYIIQNGLEAQ